MGLVNFEISKCTDGDVVASDVIGDNGDILVTKYTFLNEYIIEKLKKMGILYIPIYDNPVDCKYGKDNTFLEFSKNYIDSVSIVKQIINNISCGEKLNYFKVIEVSELIYNSSDTCGNIIKCMKKIYRAGEYIYNHCVNTAFYSMMIGKWLGLNVDEIQKLILSGFLHDIGKIKIPEEILNKKGKLTPDEFKLIKKHAIFGYYILNEIDEVDVEVKHAVLLHHERTDCSGYPLNASPDVVGIYAKIVAIADVFDAMTSERVYKKRATPFEAFEMFNTTGKGRFDTAILNVFLKNISKYYIGANVFLSCGEIGKIVYIPPEDILSPIVETGSGYVDLSVKGSPKILKMM